MSDLPFPSLQPFVVVPTLGTFNNVPEIPVIVGSPPAYSAMPFVWHVDVLLVGTFGVFVLFTLPRAVARYSEQSERSSGLLLRLRKDRTPASSGRSVPTILGDEHLETSDDHNRVGLSSSEDSHTLGNHVQATEATLSAHGHPPRRVRGWISLTTPMLSYLLNYPVAPGLPFKLLALLLAYFGVLMYNGTRGTDPFTDPRRPADIAVAQLPFAVAFAQKNNILGLLSGMGYEKLNFLHRFVGRIIVLAVNLHTGYYLYRYSMDGTLYYQSRTPFIYWGIIGTAATDVIFLCSTSYVRRRAYGLFLVTHIACFIILLIALIIHEPITLPYFLTAAILYGVDHTLRIIRTRTATAYATVHPHLNGGSTALSVPSITHGWRTGQHVRLRVVPAHGGPLALAYAWLTARWRARPYTVSTAPGNERGLELIIKAQGRSTRELYVRASGGSQPMTNEKGVGAGVDVEAARPGAPVRVLLEGPYSGPGHAQLAAFSGAVLVAGGSGITYALAHLDGLVRQHGAGRSRVRVLELVWVTQDAAAVLPLLPALRECLTPRASPEGPLALRVVVYYTRASELVIPAPETLPLGLGLRPGRPHLGHILAETCDAVCAAYGGGSARPSGVVVATCGPAQLAEEVHRAVGSVGWTRWRNVRGVEVISEYVALAFSARFWQRADLRWQDLWNVTRCGAHHLLRRTL
ncbi:ferric reductase like transmembrane component-domain-containing protein [Vararia minispora EC-137]|uniref:Ferric reductase like transmembrane component-domain-containing protein n=1 Tax=Vararia minispora EC-137 TaxID=1314806 RepID=A0ACB8QE67_9AGAM|nr:ferric reductase like transmembrane component-domain-containing protein [Vararia minispora EC-137]